MLFPFYSMFILNNLKRNHEDKTDHRFTLQEKWNELFIVHIVKHVPDADICFCHSIIKDILSFDG